jgi:DNA-binding transcriptional ArsR family regulator
VLGGLDAPVSTTELARRLGLSPAGVSAHLRVLARAGLAVATRDGRTVLYGRTPLGEMLYKRRVAEITQRLRGGPPTAPSLS